MLFGINHNERTEFKFTCYIKKPIGNVLKQDLATIKKKTKSNKLQFPKLHAAKMNTYSKSSVHLLEKKLDWIYNKNEWYSVYSLYKVSIPHEYLKTKRTITRKIEAVITWILQFFIRTWHTRNWFKKMRTCLIFPA